MEAELKRDHEKDPEVIEKRTRLFNLYVKPNYNMIYKLCIKYSFSSLTVEENYNEVLVNFYRRIETYNPARPLLTWLHIVTKRMVWDLENKRRKHDNKNDDLSIEAYEDILYPDGATSSMLNIDNYQDYYNDDILAALDEMNPIHRDALLLQESGYSLKEIAKIEYEKGTLKKPNIETIKSRLLLARKFLKSRINRDGESIVG